jgi:hypothetical protein
MFMPISRGKPTTSGERIAGAIDSDPSAGMDADAEAATAASPVKNNRK